jgi:exopolyphosphatase/guanosine-5'-triphosphate,3'-diphosphate pyrophosphatase
MSLLKKKIPELVAAIDLGSNSFHMIVARLHDGDFQIVDRLREMVRLSAGMDDSHQITEEAQTRAIECLQRFSQRLQGVPASWVRTVGTNTLRSADNAQEFIQQAEQALGYPIEIISGIEEARLIYLGVAHNIAADSSQRLVVDIGGGSTEVIIGESFSPMCLESLYMGCVTMTQQFFPNGHVSPEAMKKAEIAARVELEPITSIFKQAGWNITIGASGTVRAIEKCVRESGWSEHGISRSGLKKLIKSIGAANHVSELNIKGLAPERAPVLPGGAAILYGLFKALGIEHMEVSNGALREGLLHDLLGRIHHEDVRSRSVLNLAKRYHVDLKQSSRIEHTAQYCVNQIADAWQLDSYEAVQWLMWAAQLHETGLNIAHSHYHKHGAYIIENADLSGFTRQEQYFLSLLVRAHRRKLSVALFKSLPGKKSQLMIQLAVIFRLCVLLHRSRTHKPLPEFTLQATKHTLALQFPQDWLEGHPLTQADLEQEAAWLRSLEFELTFS